jgi:hypothetical protein
MFKSVLNAILDCFWFILFLTLSTVSGVFSGIWGESDKLASLWIYQLTLRRTGRAVVHSPVREHPVSLVMRGFAFLLQLVVLMIISNLIWWGIRTRLGL